MDNLKTAYYGVFLKTGEGRMVFNDMRKRGYAMFRDENGVCSNPSAQLAIDDFIAGILCICGIDSEQAELEALAKTAEVAANHLTEQQINNNEEPILE